MEARVDDPARYAATRVQQRDREPMPGYGSSTAERPITRKLLRQRVPVGPTSGRTNDSAWRAVGPTPTGGPGSA
uniref:Uncharacterized protein n=1 Tax=Oryza sativa subsp. japonica TaxID=39947 RepID=Q6YPC6_ORYSJ|nr:hypothetical protein [Oryza sativa Japonica Group]BAD17831.1 hypothetical protein [Oryza sativa Japonica Group]